MIKKLSNLIQQQSVASRLLRWSLLAVPVAVITGSLVALFLWLLEEVTLIRRAQGWLLYLLPVAGVLIYFLYKWSGKNAEAGNNLVIDEIHEPGGGVPARMTPLVLFTTVITHLFGGSAGREGTAVQMGGSMAAAIGRLFRLTKEDTRIILMCGIAAGFGAVFGTPITGAVFALEVLLIGNARPIAFVPCLVASVLADITCSFYGINHTAYHIQFHSLLTDGFPFIRPDFRLLTKIALGGIAFGLAALLFSELTHTIKNLSRRLIQPHWLIPAIGGAVIIVLTWALGTRDYLGLGVTNPDPSGVSILSSFREGGAGYLSWAWKLLFTAVTLGMGFKGGEVTPLFFIGAALGNTIAVLMGAPADLFAGLGFIAVFAAATNTPVACTLMGVELFGVDYILYYAIACFMAYFCSGHTGIYSSQRVGISKWRNKRSSPAKTLHQIREERIARWKRHRGSRSERKGY